MTEDGRRMTGDGGQSRTEDGGQKTGDGGRADHGGRQVKDSGFCIIFPSFLPISWHNSVSASSFDGDK